MVRENEYWLSPMFVYRENLEKESREKRDWNLAFWNWDGGENGFRFLAGEEENYGLQSLGLNKAHEIRLGERNWLGSVYHLGHLLLTLWPVAEGWVERIRMSEPRGNKDAYGWPTTWWGQVIITVTSRHVLPTLPTFGSAFGCRYLMKFLWVVTTNFNFFFF